MRAFGVTLTQASTGDARHEYVDDGTGAAWVKGEEDDEFFIVLTNNDIRPTLCKVYVDGVHLGYDYQLTAGATTPPLGVLKSGQSLVNSNLIVHALKFVKRTRDECAPGEDSDDRRLPSAGSVTVKWYNCIWDGDPNAMYGPVHSTKSWQGAAPSSSATMHRKEQSKLRSEEGSTASALSNSSTGLRARCGELLDTTTIQYTSDFGLAVRGLLTEEETGMTAKRQKTCTTMD